MFATWPRVQPGEFHGGRRDTLTTGISGKAARASRPLVTLFARVSWQQLKTLRNRSSVKYAR